MLPSFRPFLATTRLVFQKYQNRPRTNQARWNHTTVLAMSGGVDSSVAAALLQKEPNCQLTGLFMANWNAYDDDSLACSSETDWSDVQRVAQHLRLPAVHRHSFEQEYWTLVFEPFVQSIANQGHMGNPDIACNTYIKFGSLLEYVKQQYGPDTRLATGHYARLWHRSGTLATDTTPEVVLQALEKYPEENWISEWGSSSTSTDPPSLLLAAADLSKDQSYFLSGCSAEDAFRSVIFPLGEYFKSRSSDLDKPTIRELAKKLELPTARKADSMGICFVGNRSDLSFREFLYRQYMPPATDRLVFCDIDTGLAVGVTAEPAHSTLYTATSGQGAKLSGTPVKYFIVGVPEGRQVPSIQLPNKNKKRYREALSDCGDCNNIIWVCSGTHHPALYADELTVGHVSWVGSANPPPELLVAGQLWRTQCRIRHLQPLMNCTVTPVVNPGGTTSYKVQFDKPVRGISPGQQIAFYGLNGLVCLGGGPIATRGPTYWERDLELPVDRHVSGHNDLSAIKQQKVISMPTLKDTNKASAAS